MAQATDGPDVVFYGFLLSVLWITGIMVSKGNHPQMALIQVSEIL